MALEVEAFGPAFRAALLAAAFALGSDFGFFGLLEGVKGNED